MQAHKEGAGEKHGHVPSDEAIAGEDHDPHFQGLHEDGDPPFVVLVRDLPGGGGEEQEGQDEESGDEIHHQGRIHRRVRGGVEGHHHGEGELEEVVVEGAEELGPEERRETPFAQERELRAALAMRRPCFRLGVGAARLLGSHGRRVYVGGCCL